MGKARLLDFINQDEERKDKILAIGTGSHFDPRQHVVLSELGLNNTNNFKNLVKEKKKIDNQGEVIEINNLINDVRKAFPGETYFLEYSQFLKFCKANNLYFGQAHNYSGNIPEKVINALKDYNFNKLQYFNAVRHKNKEGTILSAPIFYSTAEYNIYIAASPHQFEGARAFVSNNEIISSKYCKPLKNLDKNTTRDTLLMAPVRFKDKLYFIILNNW